MTAEAAPRALRLFPGAHRGVGEKPAAFVPENGQHAPAPFRAATQAANAAAAAFPAWSALGPGERRVRLLKAADALEARRELFGTAMADEIGATKGWTEFNISLGVEMLREAAATTTDVTGSLLPSDRPGMLAMAIRQPVGVVLGIAPWNVPVVLGVRALAMPLACGNTVVLKASEICPRTHGLLGEVLGEAGLGDGIVSVVTNEVEDASAVVETLIAHPAIRRVNFTGSTRVGRMVAELSARHLKPALLELGGKAPLLVLDDADLDEAVKAACYGAFLNQGQICMSTERVIVDEAVADVFVDRLVRSASRLLAGHPPDSDAPLGPVVGHDAVGRIGGLVRDAVAKGGRIVAGGRVDGTLMDATVIDHVTSAMRIYDEECFGPVLPVIRVRGDEEAIRVANDTEYALSSAVFTRDLQRGLAVAQRVEAGICHINGATVHDEPHMPFGGMKASGYGRFGGRFAIEEFTELRWITASTKPVDYSI